MCQKGKGLGNLIPPGSSTIARSRKCRYLHSLNSDSEMQAVLGTSGGLMRAHLVMAQPSYGPTSIKRSGQGRVHSAPFIQRYQLLLATMSHPTPLLEALWLSLACAGMSVDHSFHLPKWFWFLLFISWVLSICLLMKRRCTLWTFGLYNVPTDGDIYQDSETFAAQSNERREGSRVNHRSEDTTDCHCVLGGKYSFSLFPHSLNFLWSMSPLTEMSAMFQ